ncbi:electron transport complex subunit RsxG [Aliikangiella sp. G2MR2-5]|uniref:electron transport complex subunit RsxG n=1 Tax=Aliikangiella sp. G2MR2-5 TaxID=2788943 RepID=UPI0018AC8CC8|nr:electron transport complex subunit RsxG [Aliikangiella sp. G2MR2-5]
MSDQADNVLKASNRNGLMLALFAAVSTGLIALVHLITKDKIAEEIEAAMARRLNEIVNRTEYDNDVYHDCKLLTDVPLLGPQSEVKIYRMRNAGQNHAVFLTSVAPDGYAGKIKMVIGIYKDGTLAGVRITEHQETPGLGDKIEIEKSEWIEGFRGKSLIIPEDKSWSVKKDGGKFDALTGATITPRAVIKAVKNALLFYQQNQTTLFDAKNQCSASKS